MDLSKNQQRKFERYGKIPCYSFADLLFAGEVREIRKRIYKKPGHKSLTQTDRENLIQVKTKLP